MTPVLFRIQQPVHGGVINARWTEGYWLGKCTLSDAHVVWPIGGRGVQRSRSIRARTAVLDSSALRSVVDQPSEYGDIPVAADVGGVPVDPPDRPDQGGLEEFQNGRLLGNYFSRMAQPLHARSAQTGPKGDEAYEIIADSAVNDSSASSSTTRCTGLGS